ncbi:Xaa-Pro dipeptidase [Pseudoxanthomonas jiangsuensis]|uniref:Xaa-Pro dipeptidase n=1 Tax=Pseudoxanthomonas jiangsuensis TaxID=619688 RepID=UPI00139158F0|nr:amidohydrolase family protein [Pseudoxanthomonas jiangsuensis]KAF1692040.1 Xaa-Pro dipeptidase [Pseudoxanthomonas jiangsuensis]
MPLRLSRPRRAALSLSLLLALPLAAAAETVYVRAGQLLDVESGRLLPDRAILVEDGRIARIEPAAALPPPPGATVHDLSGRTVLPGLMDAHVHLIGDADKHGYNELGESLPLATLYGARNARATLLAGFTTVRNLGSSGYADVALRDAIAEGLVDGPRVVAAGIPVGITGGHCSDNNLLPYEEKAVGEGVADGPWEVRRQVRQNVKFGADVIKTCSTGGVLSKGTQVGAPQYTLEELQALVDEAHSHGRKVASHAHGAGGILNALKAGVDSIEHASFIDDAGIALAKKNGAMLVMDIYNTEYILGEGEKAGILPESLEKERRTGGIQRESFRRAHQAGVRMAFGTDAGVYPHGQNARQFARMVRFGMTPLQAIQAATLNTAALFGIEGETGALKPGLAADLIAVDGDPLQDVSVLEQVRFVMKGGRVYRE